MLLSYVDFGGICVVRTYVWTQTDDRGKFRQYIPLRTLRLDTAQKISPTILSMLFWDSVYELETWDDASFFETKTLKLLY